MSDDHSTNLYGSHDSEVPENGEPIGPLDSTSRPLSDEDRQSLYELLGDPTKLAAINRDLEMDRLFSDSRLMEEILGTKTEPKSEPKAKYFPGRSQVQGLGTAEDLGPFLFP